MMAQLDRFVAEFDAQGRLVVPDDMAARLSADLGHPPRAGDRVTLAVVDEDAAPSDADENVERWLRTEVVASIDEMRAHPERSLSVDQVREHFAGRLAAAGPTDE